MADRFPQYEGVVSGPESAYFGRSPPINAAVDEQVEGYGLAD